jgi:hypothetical protein
MADHSAPNQYDPSCPGGIKSRLIFVLLIIGAVLLAVILAAVEAAYHYAENRINEEYYWRGNPQLQALIESQDQRLNTAARIQGDDEHVIVPVDVAIDAFLSEQGSGRP